MEELIKSGVNELFVAICIIGAILSVICLAIFKDTTDIKIMLKKHFKDSKKD